METRLFLTRGCVRDFERRGQAWREGDLLTFSNPPVTLQIRPGWRFDELLGGADRWRLLGRVLAQEELLRLGGRAASGKVEIDGRLYRVEEGFVASPASAELLEQRAGGRLPTPPPASVGGAPSPPTAAELHDLASALARWTAPATATGGEPHGHA